MQGKPHSHDCCTTFKESLLILLFEFLGTMLLTALFASVFVNKDAAGLLCGFFILLIFSARISGSHFNPAITLAFMFRRDTGRFSRLLGLLYIAAQYLGAVCGALITYNLFQAKYGAQPLSVTTNGGSDGDTTLIFQAMFMETIGSMIITFLYLTQTEEKTKMSGDPAITTLIIAATYTAVVALSESRIHVMTGSPYNPAVAMGLLWGMIFGATLKETNNSWLFLLFSYLGSILAVLLFEFVYKKAVAVAEQVEEAEDSDEHQDALISPTNV